MTIEQKREVFNLFRSELNLTFEADNAQDLSDWIENDSDFYIEIDGEEYRLIHEGDIDEIWEESLEELLRDCYEVPKELENYIDYEKWVDDCKYDGKGHHFGTYDGSEYEAGGWYIFRTN